MTPIPHDTNEAALRARVRRRLEETVPTAARDARIDRFRGCLVGGALGDALGAPVEFLSWSDIVRTFGPDGLAEPAAAYGRVGAITDDTQMTLFTAEGLLRADARARLRGIGPAHAAVTDRAYGRWLATQSEGAVPIPAGDGWLITRPELHRRRAPGLTCLSALARERRVGEPATNDSKGCGGVMRVAPVGLYCAALDEGRADPARDGRTFRLGVELAALTHGHVTGQLTAGYLSVLVAVLAAAGSWRDATSRAWACLVGATGHGETSRAVERALQAAAHEPASRQRLVELGEGWIAEEALAMSVYCAASALASADDQRLRAALLLAVNHGGDSDSTGSLTGNILGAICGEEAWPAAWRATLELGAVVGEVGEDLATFPVWDLGDDVRSPESDYWWSRYPGG